MDHSNFPDETNERNNRGSQESDDENSSDDRDDESKKKRPAGEQDDPLLEELVVMLRQFMNGGTDVPQIDVEKARNVLEASAGNLALAGQLYWDDYFASQAAENPKSSSASSSHRRRSSERNAEGRRVRRRLENDFERLHENRNPSNDADSNNDNSSNNNNNHEDAPPQEAPPARRQQEQQEQQPFDPVPDVQVVFVAARAVAAFAAGRDRQDNRNNHVPNNAESVSVSDDESGVASVLRMVGGIAAQLEDDDRYAQAVRSARTKTTARASKNPLSSTKKKSRSRDKEQSPSSTAEVTKVEGESTQSDGYCSENDWIFDPPAARLPSDLLWGTTKLSQDAAFSNKTSESKDTAAKTVAAVAAAARNADEEVVLGDNETNVEAIAGRGQPNNELSGLIVLADEDAEEEAKNENEEAATPKPDGTAGIPHSWLHASFRLHTSGTGLVIGTPTEEELALMNWSSSSSRRSDKKIPPPYHCRAITGLLSIVTAMLYTGASVVGNRVTCTSSRKPFIDLSPEDKKREFDERLTDALTALLFTAAKSSLERKNPAILATLKSKALHKNSEIWREMKGNPKILERKLKLCPTSCWHEDSGDSSNWPQESNKRVPKKIAISYSSIEHLRLYVASHLRDFQAPCGCALFLETILSIHGQGAVARMMRRAHRKAGKPVGNINASSPACLMGCTCEHRQQQIWQQTSAAAKKKQLAEMDDSALGHECMSIEMLSLLLTGKVYASMNGWSTGKLGFGILSTSKKVGTALQRPEKPVWLLQGETCYSVLLLDSHSDHCFMTKDEIETFSKIDKQGCPARMLHWNTWYNERNESGLTLIPYSAEWRSTSMKMSTQVSQGRSGRKNTTEKVLEGRRQHRLLNVVWDDIDTKAARESEGNVSLAEIDEVKIHPDDIKFYPKKFRFWRYAMGGEPRHQDAETLKPKAITWTPYFSLSEREKLIVEFKLGPKINRILWTRWPRATIEKFTPEGSDTPIV